LEFGFLVDIIDAGRHLAFLVLRSGITGRSNRAARADRPGSRGQYL